VSRPNVALLVAVAATLVLWNVPYGAYVLYPFRIFATWMHEMGHATAALLVGRSVLSIAVKPDTSGVTFHAGDSGRLALGLVASAGYMGTSVAGAALVVLGRRERIARLVLCALGAAAVLSTLLWVRNVFGFVAIPIVGAAIAAIGWKASPAVASFLLNLLGAQSAVNAVSDIRALFLIGRSTFDGGQATDAAAEADLFLLPYWFWAAIWMALSIALLAVALFARRKRA
jgi:peptidase M50B-like protein